MDKKFWNKIGLDLGQTPTELEIVVLVWMVAEFKLPPTPTELKGIFDDWLALDHFPKDANVPIELQDTFLKFEADSFKARWLWIIRNLYGIGCKKKASTVIAREISISRSRVCQIADKALKKLSSKKSKSRLFLELMKFSSSSKKRAIQKFHQNLVLLLPQMLDIE